MVGEIVHTPEKDRMAAVRRRRWLELGVVLGLLALALAVRLYRLPDFPPGLHRDEAANGMDILDILSGKFAVFFERNTGREPLFIYLQAIAVALLGRSAFALRLTSAILGALTVPAVYWMVREAFGAAARHPRRLAFWTALFLALSYWHLSFSRLGFRAIMLPLTSALAFAWFWRGWRRLETGGPFPWADMALCGAFMGLAQYTYTASRFLPVLFVLVIAAALLGATENGGGAQADHGYDTDARMMSLSVGRPCTRPWRGESAADVWPGVRGPIRGRPRPQYERLLLAAGVVSLSALVVFAPLGIYTMAHFDSVVRRSADVSVFSPAMNQGHLLKTMATSVIDSAKMFGVAGDPNPRHNPAGRPALDPLLGAWLVAGIALVCIRRRSLPHVFALLWFAVFALPATLTADGLPHSLRSLGMVPAAFLLPVLAMDYAGERLRGRWSRLAAWMPLPFLLFSAVTGVYAYFTAWGNPARYRAPFYTDFNEAAALLAQRAEPGVPWILPYSPMGPDPRADDILSFLSGRTDFAVVAADDRSAAADVQQAAAGSRYVNLLHWPQIDWVLDGTYVPGDPRHLLDFLLAKYGTVAGQHEAGRLSYTTYALPASGTFEFAHALAPTSVSFGGKIELQGVAYGHTAIDLGEPADALERHGVPSGHIAWVALRWQALAPLNGETKVSLYLADEAGHVAGQVDDLLVNERAPFLPAWQPGDTVTTYHLLPTLPAIPPGHYQLWAAVYDGQTSERYPVQTQDGTLQAPAARLGPLEVTRAVTQPAVAPTHPLSASPAAGLSLLGYDLASAQASPGDRLALTLYWRADAAPAASTAVSVELHDSQGNMIAQAQGQIPAGSWAAGDVLRDWYDLSIPAGAPPGALQLVASAGPATGVGQPVVLQTVQVAGRPHQFAAPSVGRPADLRLGRSIAFLGYDLAAQQLAPGATLGLTLYWQAVDRVDGAYTVFVHLLGPDGKVWGQQDSQPGGGALPTSGWVVGEYVTDRYEVALRPDAPAGAYRVEIGLYDAATNQRLPVTTPAAAAQGDRILLDQPLQVGQ